ncbi:hypothetical protein SLE2022_175280 [Rubroshorea leprosula]
MTAEVGVHDEMSTKVDVDVEVEEKKQYGLDLSNGINGTAQEEDDDAAAAAAADGCYVFVSGKDAVEGGDPVEADLKGNGNGTGELEIVNGDQIDVSGGGDLTVPIQDRNGEPFVSQSDETQNGESSIPEDVVAQNIVVKGCHEPEFEFLGVGDRDLLGQVKSDLGLGLEENNESQIGVEGAVQINPDQDKDFVELTADHPVGGHSSATHDNADKLPHHIAREAASQTDVAIGSNGSSPETPETSSSFNVPAAHIVQDSATVEGALGNPASGLGDNSELAAEIQLGDEIVGLSVPDQSVEVLPDSHAQDQDPETIVEVDANQTTTEQENFPALPVDEVRTEAEVGKSELNLRESADHGPVDSLEVANKVAENFPASVVDEVGTEAEVGKSELNVRETADSHPVDSSEVAESASVPTINQLSTVPEVEESVENTLSSPADEVGIEPEVEKTEEKGSGIASSHCIDNSEIETEVTESFQASSVDDVQTAAEVLKSDEDGKGTADSHPSNNSEVAIEVSENLPSSAVDEVSTEAEAGKSEWKFCADADSHLVDNSEVIGGAVDNDGDTTPSCLANGATSESKTSSDSVVSIEVVSSLPSTAVGTDSKVDIAVENFSAESSRDMPANDSVATEPEKLNGTASDSEQNCAQDDDKVAHIENGGIQLSNIDHDKLCQESEAVNVVHKDESTTCSSEGSAIDTSEGQNPIPEGGKRRFYLVKVPRYDDENLKEQIRQAQLRVDERTESRDEIRAEIKKKKATCKELSDNFEDALSQERAARELLKSKRQEIDSLQSAISIEDIDGRIRNMEHSIQHETLPLKEEKQLIREIKQLKQTRENLSSNMGRQDGVQQTSEQKDQIEGRLKSLKKEADLLRDNVLKAEAFTKAAKKKLSEENEKLSKLLSEFRSADSIRQEAYAQLQSLRKQSYEKNKYFWQYRDDAKAAYDLAFKRDIAALEKLCASQVENNMDILNKNDEYRKDYFRCNVRSTLRRLKTLDGRSIGPDEEPPVIPHVVNERVAKDGTLPISSPEGETREQVEPAEAEKVKGKPVMKTAPEKNPAAKPKKSSKSGSPANSMETASVRDEIQEPTEEEQKKTKEEEELSRKAEELRKKEEEAKLMEQRRLDEKAKAKEALERKKRNAEKAQARAVLRAQKEAELKEKEREKKAKKKERRKAATAGEDSGVTNEVESEPTSETPIQTPNEPETREKQVATTKKPQKQSLYTKQSKAKSIPPPPPLRNRGKRRMQPWMWVLLTVLVVFALFLVGNGNFSFNFGLNRF